MGEATNKHLWFCLAAFYGLLVYFSLYQQWGLDFSSYYVSSHELALGRNPYHNWISSDRTWVIDYLPGNPNPPLTLLLFSVFSYLNYPLAFAAWLFFSSALGLYGVYRCLLCLKPDAPLNISVASFFLLYLSAFPVVMNVGLLQLGGVLLFLVTLGYSAYLKRQESWAAFWWSLFIAIKLFPGLLFIYVLLKGRYKLFTLMSVWCLFWFILPLSVIDMHIYIDYFIKIAHDINWYGINWNASLFGFLYRLLLDVQYETVKDGIHPERLFYVVTSSTQWVKNIYYILVAGILFCWTFFFERIEEHVTHRGFAFLLILMIMLSPMGWLYYFPLLCLPLICTFYDSLQRTGRIALWFSALFLLYFPAPLTHAISMSSFSLKISYYSVHFYGILLLAYLTLTMENESNKSLFNTVPTDVSKVWGAITFFSLLFVTMRMFFLMGLRLLR